MKIYIENYNINKLANKMTLFVNGNYYSETKNELFIYSDDGFFKIDDKNILKINVISDKVNRTQSKGLIIDESKIMYETCNYIPFNHVSEKVTKFIYKINSKSKLKLVIEGFYEENIFLPKDFYFETNIEEKICNPIIKDDLNEFLSLLN
jgi:DNA polymerase elongation subunit (family B)